jgi:hypothetical protein
MAKLSEVAAAIAAVNAKLNKASTEIVTLIESLRASDPDLSPEGNAALAELQSIAQRLDDVVPDAPEAEPEVSAPDASTEAAV